MPTKETKRIILNAVFCFNNFTSFQNIINLIEF
jgi:hypothetical protein